MKKIMGIASAVALVAVAAPAAHADAKPVPTETSTIRSADLLPAPLKDTRATGHVEFLRQGLHLWTEGATGTDKVAEYFPVTGALPTRSRMTWNGTAAQPGVQIVFDVDGTTGNGNDYNILVGEPVYGVDGDGYYTDWWATGASSVFSRTAPGDPVPGAGNQCPVVGGGFGSQCHGTLAQWSAKLPSARMLAGGFSLGSGVKGDGILTSIEYGTSVYGFTNIPVATAPAQGTGGTTTPTTSTAAPVVKDVTGTFSSKKSRVRVKVKFTADALPAGTTQGKKIQWKVKVDRTTALKLTQGAGDTDVFKTPRLKGKHVVQVFKDGVLVKTIRFRSKA